MKFSFTLSGVLTIAVIMTSCSKETEYKGNQEMQLAGKSREASIVIKSSSNINVSINSALDEFRALLGQLNNAPAAPGSPGLTTGRREVNWDGVQAPNLNNDNFPGGFFGSFNPLDGNGRKRGILFSTPGSGLRVSDNDLADIDPSYPDQFDAFSPAKIFIAEGSTITDVHFKVPGTNNDASVTAFGVVFSGVDNGGSTSILFYRDSELLGEFKAPRRGADGFSFLGVYFPETFVTHVRIVSGSHPVGPGVLETGKDLVVMDDFIYSEPQSL